MNVEDFVTYEKIHITHKCDFCDKYFKSKTDLTQHMSVHSQRESIFYCKTCTKSYENMEKLRRQDWRNHREIHCTICGKTLQNRE